MPKATVNGPGSIDPVIDEITGYVTGHSIESEEAYSTARLCLMDALGCAMEALDYPACRRLLGPIVPGATLINGACVPGTDYTLDPVAAAFNLGAMIRWLDYNDTWLAAEWGHPSDNLGGILMVADWLARQQRLRGTPVLTMRTVLTDLIKAYEIQGILGLGNSFNRVGLDHVLLVRVATAAVVAQMLGCSREEVTSAVSNAWVDGGSLRVYRHSPHTGSRKSWAAGDATARGVFLALLASRGEMGYPSGLSAPKWGFSDVFFKGQPILLHHPFDSYVMENILFKVAYPAEFHGQTAVEAAIRLHPQVKNRIAEINQVVITTQESAMRIIDKHGPLRNPADRDHCIQYMTAVGLIFGGLSAKDYEDEVARDLRIDQLRDKMICVEDPQFSRDYLDPEKRSIANAIQVFFTDGSQTEKVVVEYPIGHRRRRGDALPLLEAKLKAQIRRRFSERQVEAILSLRNDPARLDVMPVDQFVGMWI